MKANGLADRYAKEGMAKHRVHSDIVAKYLGLKLFANEVGKFVGRHQSWFDDNEYKDALSITDPPLRQLPASSSMQEAELSASDRQRQSAVWSHNLFAARIEMGDETQRPGTVFGCRDCGAYTWRRRTKLLAQCPQRPTSQPMREQKERMATGLFPGDR